jgi:nucleotide-binding universal stress UspA family protein
MNTILLASDGSPSARQAEEEAFALAHATRWRLHVVTVWHAPSTTNFGYVPVPPLPELAQAEREAANEVAVAVVERAAAVGVDATFEVRQGYPADEICRAAELLDARLVVVGAHGWGAFKRVVFGSVSSAVLHHAPCGVLVVRGVDDEIAAAEEESTREAAFR